MNTTTQVNTAHVKRRTLRFNTIDEALAEVAQIAAAERAGTLRRLGNWTTGQNLGHLATWAEFAFTGVPLKIPFFVRWMIRPMKRRLLAKGLPAGKRLPKVAGGTLGHEELSLEEGERRFRAAFLRLKNEMPPGRHVLFGKMTHEEWMALNLRHAELHLSFLAPQ